MLKRSSSALSFAALLGLSPFALAEPCLLEEDGLGGYRVTEDCYLVRERFANIRDGIELRAGSEVQLSLPDLVPVDTDFDLAFGTNDHLVLEVKIANRGTKDAAPFDVEVLVEAYRSGNQVLSETAWINFGQGLRSGDDLRVTAPAAIPFQYQYGDYLVMTIFTDSRQAQSGGAIWESNEQNNVGEERCRINSQSNEFCDDGALRILPTR